MIRVSHLSKTYGRHTAVDDVSFTAGPGMVTGLIGPNGSGKSTTLRIMLGLSKPTSGEATIFGSTYRDLAPFPLFRVGALLDHAGPVPERRAIDHLRWVAQTHGIGKDRVNEVVDIVGLTESKRKRVGTYSLGMKQRLGIAAALLGDPEVLILDEPMNGLDPEGIVWVRNLLKQRAEEGGTVLVSSHFMGELETVAQKVVILSHSRVVAEGCLSDIIGTHASLEEAYFHLTRGHAQ